MGKKTPHAFQFFTVHGFLPVADHWCLFNYPYRTQILSHNLDLVYMHYTLLQRIRLLFLFFSFLLFPNQFEESVAFVWSRLCMEVLRCVYEFSRGYWYGNIVPSCRDQWSLLSPFPPLLCSNAVSDLCKDRSLFDREKRMNNQIIWK